MINWLWIIPAVLVGMVIGGLITWSFVKGASKIEQAIKGDGE